ncbi:Gfo/Idh/MocA family protein [Aspergillus homomorphus CBS 101889]|uniref:D-xylose 1-dehydrogenase (NADP(+), D-xylono-1,5-lactone-forming) n=1 Tax=Aspergillus homomorphus (strain CBS 101889) TaxID=1450537 RepID=A0A395HXD3_ASPHC|nr:NAD(P)-binding protein [Aspergillus homomorphus CBS 101889]RAL12582.1 NAD(P)-binding protein [Aspergillus homomorphus CBS 101889]
MQHPIGLTWGILATGRIAESECSSFSLTTPFSPHNPNPIGRRILHLSSYCLCLFGQSHAPESVTPYDSYSALLSSSCEAIYVATPHSHHYQNAMMALEARKHILIEKPIAVNQEQARTIFETAAKKQLFVMERLWTRFQPVGNAFRQVLGDVGPVRRIWADNGLGMDVESQFPESDRMVLLNLAGGSLLDWGIYSLNWVLQALGQRGDYTSCSAASVMMKYACTGVDESKTILLKFLSEEKHEIQAIIASSLRCATDADGNIPCLRVQGDNGETQVFGWPWRPSKLRIIARQQGFGNQGTVVKEILNIIPNSIYGLVYEADEMARCIYKGKLESETMSWKECLATMGIMDQVRKENGLWFGDEAESVTYPLV